MKFDLIVSVDIDDGRMHMQIAHAGKVIGALILPTLDATNPSMVREQRDAIAGAFMATFSRSAQSAAKAERDALDVAPKNPNRTVSLAALGSAVLSVVDRRERGGSLEALAYDVEAQVADYRKNLRA